MARDREQSDNDEEIDILATQSQGDEGFGHSLTWRCFCFEGLSFSPDLKAEALVQCQFAGSTFCLAWCMPSVYHLDSHLASPTLLILVRVIRDVRSSFEPNWALAITRTRIERILGISTNLKERLES